MIDNLGKAIELTVPPRPGDILGAIDGTGPDDAEDYDNEFASSFVHQVKREWDRRGAGGRNSIYRDGPTTFDWDRSVSESSKAVFSFVLSQFRSLTARADMIIQNALNRYHMTATPRLQFGADIMACMRQGPSQYFTKEEAEELRNTEYPRVFLTGYSRGGAAVIHTAELLQNRGIEVYCMLLFDAVNRTVGDLPDTDEIPDNVWTCHHAKRSPQASSRDSFGNCGIKWNFMTTVFQSKDFMCTHGAMGGTPWTLANPDLRLRLVSNAGVVAASGIDPNQEYILESGALATTNITLRQDAAVSAEVAAWMNERLNKSMSAGPRPYLQAEPF